MRRLTRRLDAARCLDDQGSALAISLVFLMVFGLLVGATLQFAASGQKTTTAIRDEGINTYAGSGALDGAINRLRTELAPGTEADGTSTCFTVPADELDNSADVSVTCTPRPGSGATTGPSDAIVALSTNAAEGVSLAASTTRVRGAVAVNQQLLVPAGSLLSSKTTTLPVTTGSIKAGICSVAGTSDPPCVGPGGATDPGWAGPTAYPAVVRLAPVVCQSPVMRLEPGTYLSQAELQAVLNCGSTVVWFQPGTYYFDFRDANQELLVDANDVVVGGAASGWTPGTTASTLVPFPTVAAPDASACDRSQTGVNFVFGGTSRMSVTAGKVQLCARETSSTKPNIVMQALPTTSAILPAAARSSADATNSIDVNDGGTSWGGDDDEAAAVDANYANVTIHATKTSRALRIGPFPTNLVPPEATGITVTVDVTEKLTGYGSSRVRLNNNGTSAVGPVSLRTCPAGGCADAQVQVDSVPVPVPLADAAAVALVNNLYVDVLVSSSSSGSTIADIDGVTVTIAFSAPIRPTSGSGIGAPYTTSVATRRPVLRTSGTAAATVVALHGTVHVPLAVVDLGVTDVPYTVIDRGIVARHVQLAMTPATAGVNLIALPVATAAPRDVLLVASSGSVELARAEARLHDSTGMANGPFVDITAWFVH